jgi:hypothetical protein
MSNGQAVTFDPRLYLDSIAEEIDCGNEIDCPATTAHRIRLAGEEIDRLRAELAQRTAERDEAWLTNATLRADLARANAERDDLAAEIAALKAQPDPLAEMWRELSEYQEQADRDGHGESWRTMCRERTVEAAGHAAQNAQRFWARHAGFYCVQATGKGAFQARSAIDSIRRAKEVQR